MIRNTLTIDKNSVYLELSEGTLKIGQKSSRNFEVSFMTAYSGTNLKSTTLENAVLETAMLLQITEAIEGKNPNQKNQAQVTFDTDRGIAQISITLPVTLAIDSTTGAPTFLATPYLT